MFLDKKHLNCKVNVIMIIVGQEYNTISIIVDFTTQWN